MSRKQRDKLLETLNNTSTKVRSGFGASILAKYGWKEGQGLGKSEEGITEPVKICKNEGTSGLGSSKSDEWHNWWDDMYNELASRIKVGEKTDSQSNTTRKVEIKKRVKKDKKGLGAVA